MKGFKRKKKNRNRKLTGSTNNGNDLTGGEKPSQIWMIEHNFLSSKGPSHFGGIQKNFIRKGSEEKWVIKTRGMISDYRKKKGERCK